MEPQLSHVTSVTLDPKMKVGDLVRSIDLLVGDETGIVVKIHRDVEVPPLVEVLWCADRSFSKCYEDELVIIQDSLESK